VSARPTLVVAALAEELAPLRDRLRDSWPLAIGEVRAWRGRLAGAPVVLAVTGDGARAAAAGGRALLATLALERVLVVGTAGALTGGLTAGALVAATEVRRPGQPPLRPPLDLGAAGLGPADVMAGVVITADRIIDTAEGKRRLAQVHADAACAVVDLESAHAAAAAEARGVPWAVLRAVSDTAAEDLPRLLNRCRDDGGRIRRGRVLGSLLVQPASLPALLRLRRRVRSCAERLAAAIERVVGGVGPGGERAAPGIVSPEEKALR
jgi:adenosylhomocysteine nucleosidase